MALTRLKSPAAAARWLEQWCTGTLRSDSRQVQPGDAFIAWPGYANDGRRFVTAALAAGARTCLVESEGVETFGFDDARVAALPGLKAATGQIADEYFGRPSTRLDLVATTGTNGKTSTAWWTAQALSSLGRRCGVVGTLGVGEPSKLAFTGLTTPDPVTLQAALRNFADQGFTACAIEASSIGIVEHRLAGTHIGVALFTNFTRDHLDYHGSMAAYWAAKRALFDWPGLQAAVLNIDDEQGARLAADLQSRPLDLWSVSARTEARLCARDVAYVDGGLAFVLHEGAVALPVRSKLIGDYNAHNLLVVLGGLRALGVSLADAVAVVPGLTPVPGRLQRVGSDGGPEVVVDYAHTPDALEKVLLSLQPLAAARGGVLWCVFGCGGNRDASKRPLMGAIAARLAGHVVVTSDNPRHEAPQTILDQIHAGIQGGRVDVIDDRRAAIGHALREAANDDVVVIAGKGHEDYQEIEGVKHPFSDVDEAALALHRRAAARGVMSA
ncbi:MAG TPA: UDP-N-acetylmuramoyl-L-alanyl-D-glutamate--2,6-diaminopimelate ligase [Rubrivivax sp.]